MSPKYKSRKLWITQGLITMIYLGPLIYKANGISDEVTMWAMGYIAVLGGSYLGVNILQKKIIGEDSNG